MKKVTFFSLLLLSLIACNNTKISDSNSAIVKQYFDHFNKHDWQNMAKMYTEVADFKDPSLGKGIVKQTHAQIIQKYSELGKMFPDLKDEVAQMYPSGEKHIVVEFISKGTAPDGSKFELPICTVFTIENGKIAKDFTYYDNSEK
jgi:ketosteroid isomerase-like protein